MSRIDRAEIDQAAAGSTVASRFAETVHRSGDRAALRWQDGDRWAELTFAQWADQACRAAGGLRRLGLQPGQRVVLMMRNRPEFHVIDVAVLLCGATPISIYNSSSAEQVEYVAGHSEAFVAAVEDLAFLERFREVRDRLPMLRHIVVVDDKGSTPDDASPWTDLLAADPVDLAEASALARAEDLVTVIYTSGTTGPPKGVMLTHANVVWTAESYQRLLEGTGHDITGFRTVSYLPMAHVAERLASHYLAILAGLEVTACPEPGLLASYLRETKPQSLFGVPRVWEKMHSGVMGAIGADPAKAQQFDEAVKAAMPLRAAELEGPLDAEAAKALAFLDEVAFSGVREMLGLDQVRFAVTGAAPIPPELIEWFRAIGVPMSEIYGMSENTGPMTWDPVEVRIGTVGRALPGVEIKLLDDGEVVGRGGHIFAGYLDDPEKTAEALDGEGWLHTGDIGQIDSDGYLRIVDRKKELIITAGGKNISPANIEAALKSFPLIGQVAVIGDSRPFISALIVLDPEVAPSWARQQGIEVSSLAELAQNETVRAEVERSVAESNRRFSQVEQVKRFALLGAEWLPDSDELTPTSKLKRRGVSSKYAQEIAALYA